MTTTVSFTPLEAAVHYIEGKTGPWNVQFEVETASHVDADRLREATLTACNAHHLARARQQSHSGMDVECRWEIPDAIDALAPETVVVVDDLTAERKSQFYHDSIDLTEESPVRLLVERGGGRGDGDRLLVCTSHVAADGVGGTRFVRTLCQAYRGVDPDEPVDFDRARRVVDDARPPAASTGLDLLGEAIEFLGNSVDPPARVAADGGTESAAGWHFDQRRLDAALTERVMSDRPDGSSVNDVLLAALHLCIDDWNHEHGESAGKISLMMPLNLRPREWFYDSVGMFAAFDSISTRRSDRTDPLATVEKVVDQTRRVKDRDRTTISYEVLKLVPPGTPVGLKERFPDLLRGLGRRFVDTAALSNLGRIPDPLPRLEESDEPNLWFSPPAQSPQPVGIGVATVDGTVHLAGRYSRDTFDAEAAEAFTDVYLDCLEEIVA